MKTDEVLFAEAMTHVRNGPKKVLPPQPEGTALSRYNGYISKIIEKENINYISHFSSKQRTEIPRIIGGTIDDGSANAIAAMRNGRCFIGVNWGAAILFDEIFYRLFSYPEFMPWIGNPSKVRPDPLFVEHPLRQDITNTFGTFVKLVPTGYPQDVIRMHAAQCMGHVSHMALIAHELRHIYGGHLRLDENDTFPSIDEIHSINPVAGGGLIDQALERDADCGAIGNTLSNLIAWQTYSDNFMAQYGEFFDSHIQVLEAALLIHDVYLKIFDLNPPPDPLTWERLTHPPEIVRRSMMVDRILEIISHKSMTNFKYTQQEFINTVVPRVYSISENIVNPLFGLPKREIDFATLEPHIIAHKAKIESTWQELNKKLKLLRYFDLTMDMD